MAISESRLRAAPVCCTCSVSWCLIWSEWWACPTPGRTPAHPSPLGPLSCSLRLRHTTFVPGARWDPYLRGIMKLLNFEQAQYEMWEVKEERRTKHNLLSGPTLPLRQWEIGEELVFRPSSPVSHGRSGQVGCLIAGYTKLVAHTYGGVELSVVHEVLPHPSARCSGVERRFRCHGYPGFAILSERRLWRTPWVGWARCFQDDHKVKPTTNLGRSLEE